MCDMEIHIEGEEENTIGCSIIFVVLYFMKRKSAKK